MERSSIPVQFEELKSSGNLPSPTGVGMRILELTQTDDYSAEDMAEAIMSDPSLTGRILQLANSASVAGNEAVTTVSGAIMRLGGATVRSIALAFSLVSEREAGACRPFDYERYWSLSLARAVGAQELAKRTGVSKPEEAYIAGLLAEVGMLALASVHSTRYGQILIASQGKSLGALRQAEQDEFDIDHATVAECMLAEWGLPDVFGVAIGEFCRRRRFEPDRAEIASVADIVRFSDSIGSALLLGETTPARRLTEIGDQLEILRDVLDVDEPQAISFCDSIGAEWRKWGEELEIETTDTRFSQVFVAIAAGRERAAEEERQQNSE
ncbi:MAG: HDOD domain-containing protein, partial [Planctomycetota bacterium]